MWANMGIMLSNVIGESELILTTGFLK